MKQESAVVIRKICIWVGVCLLIVAMATLALWRWNIDRSEKRSQYYVDTLQALIPQPQNAVPEERRDNTMSVLSVDGTDFAGVIELPRYESVLPVCADWGKASQYPCRFSGSIYDRTIQIGATTQKGQYDFYRDLSIGDTLIFTDMEGNRFSYEITNIKYAKNADRSTLESENSALTLFVKNVYGFEYIIIYCDTLN